MEGGGPVNRNRCHIGEEAFTLLELLVVCTLISIMLAVTVPTMRDTVFTDPLRVSTRKIIGTVKGLRERAIREQQEIELNYNIGEGRLWYEENVQNQNIEQKKTEIELPDSVKIVEVWTKTEGRIYFGSSVLWISKQGYMDKTVITLGDDDETTVSIIISPFLGSFKVVDNYSHSE